MKRTFNLYRAVMTGLFAALIAFSALNVRAQTPQEPADGVRRITKEELSKMLNDKKSKVLIVDVRNEYSYKNGHIKGALNIPWGELDKNYKRLPRKGTLIVLYCS